MRAYIAEIVRINNGLHTITRMHFKTITGVRVSRHTLTTTTVIFNFQILLIIITQIIHSMNSTIVINEEQAITAYKYKYE